MPVVTPFGDLTLGDQLALDAWARAHSARHGQYAVKGIGPPGGTFEQPVDGDWMLRHTVRHVSLATVVGDPMPSALTKALSLPHKWQTEQELQDWHAAHNRLHSVIDHHQGIAQSKPAPPGLPPAIGQVRPPRPTGTQP